MEKTCPQCGEKSMQVDAVVICPHCYHIEVDDHKWEGKSGKCPRCKTDVKLFQTPGKGFVFHCHECHTVGTMVTEEEYNKKHYEISRDSVLGKKLFWLLEVPCPVWRSKHDIETQMKHCKTCEIKKVCDEHTNAIEEFCSHGNYEVYVSKDFIEIVHK